MIRPNVLARILAVVCITGTALRPAPQAPAALSADEKTLREYTGVYRWQDKGFVYLQIWNELAGKDQLVVFDESGWVRTLYPTVGGRFFTGPGAAIATPVESQVEFQRDGNGKIVSLAGSTRAPRRARRTGSRSRNGKRCA